MSAADDDTRPRAEPGRVAEVPAPLLAAAPPGAFAGVSWLAPEVHALRALPGRDAAARAAALHVTGNDRFTPAERAEIYREQFWLRHTASLLEDYPALSRLIGQARWESLVEGYLERHPPRHWSLSRLGEALPTYVRTRTDLPHAELAYALACFEAAWCAVFDAPDGARLDPAQLAAITPADWPRARLHAAPGLAVLVTAFPVAALRSALLADGDAPPALPAPADEHLVLYRDAELHLRAALLDPVEHALFARLRADGRLLAACESLAAERPPLAAALGAGLGAWLARWARLGWITAVTLDAP